MKWRFFAPSAVLAVVATYFAAPSLALAATGKFLGPIWNGACLCPPTATTGPAPDFGCLLQVFQNVVNVGVTLVVFFVVIIIAYSGFRFMVTGGSAEAREQARNLLTNAVVGLLLTLGAWLIVDFIMKTIYEPTTAVAGQNFGPWNAILKGKEGTECVKVNTKPESLTDGAVTALQLGVFGGGGTSGGGGSCTPPNGGACSVSTLQSSCFGSSASAAAQICNAESGNNPNKQSGSDVTSDGHAYSVGLFQINLTNSFNKQVDGKNCSAAFSGPCQNSNGYHNVTTSGPQIGHCSVTVIDQTLYQHCVTAATDGATNVSAACSLNSNGSSGWGRWSTASQCGL